MLSRTFGNILVEKSSIYERLVNEADVSFSRWNILQYIYVIVDIDRLTLSDRFTLVPPVKHSFLFLMQSPA